MESVRWCFNFGTWKPLKEEWLLIGRCIQPEERERISRFVFKKDMKSAMSGRLLLRHLIHQKLGLPYSSIKLGRSDKGKPFLINKLPEQFDGNLNFNISHQGHYAVLAAEFQGRVGVDVMKIEYTGGKSVLEFFRLMKRQFTTSEWSNITAPYTEHEQLSQFYRHWCLKESYVKALGVGIGFELGRLSFQIRTPQLQIDKVTCDTKLYLDNKDISEDWTFEESLLDKDHCVAVAVNKQNSSALRNYNHPTFKFLDFDEIVKHVSPWQTVTDDFWNNFNSKDESPCLMQRRV